MWCSGPFFSPFLFWLKPFFGLAFLGLLAVGLFFLLRRAYPRTEQQELAALRDEIQALRQSIKEMKS